MADADRPRRREPAPPPPSVVEDPVRAVARPASLASSGWRTSPTATRGSSNRLDVYRHRSHPDDAPTLIHLHGGRFRWGSKSREARPLLFRLASQGWTCISANYRLTPTPADGVPRPSRRRQEGHRVGPLRRPPPRCRSRHDPPRRQLRRRPPHRDGGAHRQRSGAAAGIRGGGHLDQRRDRAVRLLRAARRARGLHRRAPSTTSPPTPRRSSSSTAPTTRTPHWRGPERSPRGCGRRRPGPSPSPSSPAGSTRSTSSTRSASKRSSTRSRRSAPGCGADLAATTTGRRFERDGDERCEGSPTGGCGVA